MLLRIYTDGSGDNTKKVAAGAFLVLNEKNEIINSDSFALGNGTSLLGETRAVVKALEFAASLPNHNETDIEIYYDYIGIGAWITGEWKTRTEVAKAYFRDVYALKNKFHSLRFIKVKAHADNEFNQRVDRLAYNALNSYREV